MASSSPDDGRPAAPDGGRGGGPQAPAFPGGGSSATEAALRPPAIETRGITVYIAPDEPRDHLLRRMERWLETGFNFLVLKVFVGGRVVAPLEGLDEGGVGGEGRRRRRGAMLGRRGAGHDPVASLLDIARMFGVPVYAGFELLEHRERRGAENELLRAHREWYIPAEWEAGRELARRELSRRGDTTEGLASIRWMNPAHPAARRFLGDLVVETVTAYPFEGVHFDHLTLPAAVDPSPDEFFPTRDLLDHWIASMELPSRAAGASLPASDWNEWLANQVVSLLNYLRARVYKVRAHLTMMAEVLGSPSHDSQAPGYEPPIPVGYLEVDWMRAIETVLDMLAPSYVIGGKTVLRELDRDLALLGADAPVTPILRLAEPEIATQPFEELRASSVFGFVIDAGRPLLESQWAALATIFGEPAVCAHDHPEKALAAVQAHTLALLPPRHDLAEMLRAMDHLMRSADASQVERTRLSLVRNLEGLISEKNRAKLKLDAALEPRILRNLGLMIRLHAVLASRGQMLKATPYHFS